MKGFLQFCVEDKERHEEYDYRQHTGPREFHYIRNKGGAKQQFHYGSRYGQDIEPHGRYMQERPSIYKHDPASGLEQGVVHFKNPVILPHGGGYNTPTNWKNVLSASHGGRKGRVLSKHLIKKGHDGIITHDDQGHSGEVVDLTSFK